MHERTVNMRNRNIIFIYRIGRNFFPFRIIAKNFPLKLYDKHEGVRAKLRRQARYVGMTVRCQ